MRSLEKSSVSEDATASRSCARDEMDVRVHGVACGGQNTLAAFRLLGGKSHGFDQPQPLLDSAGPCPIALVIEYALAPGEAKIGIVGARENGRVLYRNAALIGKTIQRPGLQLPARELAFVHEQMERMLVVIAFLADGVETRDEFFFGKLCAELGIAHSSNSIPS